MNIVVEIFGEEIALHATDCFENGIDFMIDGHTVPVGPIVEFYRD